MKPQVYAQRIAIPVAVTIVGVTTVVLPCFYFCTDPSLVSRRGHDHDKQEVSPHINFFHLVSSRAARDQRKRTTTHVTNN